MDRPLVSIIIPKTRKENISQSIDAIQTSSYKNVEIVVVGSFFNRVRNFERQFYTGTVVDVVRFVRAENCPKFDVTMSGPEDSDWDRRVTGAKHISTNCLYHYDNISLERYVEKKAYYSKSMKRYKELHPSDKILDLKYRCFGIFTERGKWKRLLKHPILALGILFILVIRGIIWLRK